MGAVVWALSPDPLWGLSPVTERLCALFALGINSELCIVIRPRPIGSGSGVRIEHTRTGRGAAPPLSCGGTRCSHARPWPSCSALTSEQVRSAEILRTVAGCKSCPGRLILLKVTCFALVFAFLLGN